MIYTLKFEGRFGLWELKIDNFPYRFSRTRDAAMKLVTRYRRAIQRQADIDEQMEEANRYFERQEARANMRALWDVRG